MACEFRVRPRGRRTAKYQPRATIYSASGRDLDEYGMREEQSWNTSGSQRNVMGDIYYQLLQVLTVVLLSLSLHLSLVESLTALL